MLWYSLEVPQWGASNEYLQHMFSSRNKKNIDTFWLKKSALSRAMYVCWAKIQISLHFWCKVSLCRQWRLWSDFADGRLVWIFIGCSLRKVCFLTLWLKWCFSRKVLILCDSTYIRTLMARTSLGPWEIVRDMGSSSHWRLIMVPGQEANGGNLGKSFQSYI